MALHPLLKKLVNQSGEKCPKTRRDQYLPRASVLGKLPHHHRVEVLDHHRRHLEQEVARQVLNTCVGRRKFLKSARARMKRLERLEQMFGIQPDASHRRAA